MPIAQSAASGIGALAKGVGLAGFGVGRGIWNSGGGGKGFLIGAAAGGIYGAASAEPYESGLKRGLYGAGFGAVGGAIGGSLLMGGVGKGKAAIAARRAKKPKVMTAYGQKLMNSRADKIYRKAARIKGKIGSRSQRARRGTGNWLTESSSRGPIRINRAMGKRGAFGRAVYSAKKHKQQFMAKHKAKRNAQVEWARAKANAVGQKRRNRSSSPLSPSRDESEFFHGPTGPTDWAAGSTQHRLSSQEAEYARRKGLGTMGDDFIMRDSPPVFYGPSEEFAGKPSWITDKRYGRGVLDNLNDLYKAENAAAGAQRFGPQPAMGPTPPLYDAAGARVGEAGAGAPNIIIPGATPNPNASIIIPGATPATRGGTGNFVMAGGGGGGARIDAKEKFVDSMGFEGMYGSNSPGTARMNPSARKTRSGQLPTTSSNFPGLSPAPVTRQSGKGFWDRIAGSSGASNPTTSQWNRAVRKNLDSNDEYAFQLANITG